MLISALYLLILVLQEPCNQEELPLLITVTSHLKNNLLITWRLVETS
jgi:hypothetical protein